MSGTLDTSFGTNGVVVTDFSGNNISEAISVAIDQNNNIIVAGIDSNGDNYNYALAKYLSTGQIDTSFGTNGVVISDFSGNNDSLANSVAIDQNNNIIVAGIDFTSNFNYALVKYLSTGQIDTSFGTNGVVVTDFSGNNDSGARSVAIDQNNNIIVAGYNGSGGINNYALAKYSSTGQIDTSFGTNGVVVTDFSGNDNSYAYSVAIDQNNNIIVAGIDITGGSYNYALAKYSSSGHIDTSFGTNGVVVTDFSGNNNSYANSVAIDKNNNIIVAGYDSTGNSNYALAKYLSTGQIDTNFGTNGVVVTDFSGNDNSYAYSVAIDQNNNIIVAGIDITGGNYNYALAKYSSSGHIDTSFGTNGVVVTDFSGNNNSYANSVAIDKNNNIIVAGGIYITGNYNYALAKYFNFQPPVSNICFPAGTPIKTNQGFIPIEKINPKIHTICKKKIIGITKTLTLDNYLVCFEKDSLGKNLPSEKTIISRNHKIFYKGKMIKANNFLENFKNVYKVDYDGEVLYNVLMEEYDKMIVNNLICETLDPENLVAKLYMRLQKITTQDNKKSVEKKINMILKNHTILKNDTITTNEILLRNDYLLRNSYLLGNRK